jgi:hypothetical protein
MGAIGSRAGKVRISSSLWALARRFPLVAEIQPPRQYDSGEEDSRTANRAADDGADIGAARSYSYAAVIVVGVGLRGGFGGGAEFGEDG